TNTSTNRSIVTGAGPGGALTVNVFEIDATTGKQSLIASFFAGDPRYPDSKGGVRVSVGGMWNAGAYALPVIDRAPPTPVVIGPDGNPVDTGTGDTPVPRYDGPDSPHDIFASPASAARPSAREFWP